MGGQILPFGYFSFVLEHFFYFLSSSRPLFGNELKTVIVHVCDMIEVCILAIMIKTKAFLTATRTWEIGKEGEHTKNW